MTHGEVRHRPGQRTAALSTAEDRTEVSGYGSARALAAQTGRPEVAQLLARSLAEEENADNLLTQIARELMGQVRTGTTKAPKLVGGRDEE